MSTKTSNAFRKQSSINNTVTRVSQARDLMHDAGIPPAAFRPILRDCAESAGEDHERYLKLIQQKIGEFKGYQEKAKAAHWTDNRQALVVFMAHDACAGEAFIEGVLGSDKQQWPDRETCIARIREAQAGITPVVSNKRVPRTGGLIAVLQSLTPEELMRVWDFVTDYREMRDEGYSTSEICQYLRRTYGTE